MTALIDTIVRAHTEIRPQVPVSPLQRSAALSQALGCEVLLKCEHLQPTGSFKIRGATSSIQALLRGGRQASITTASSGNHGQAVARAGAALNVKTTVYVAATASRPKVEAIRALGVDLVTVEGSPLDAELLARKHAVEQGKTYISPYNDLTVMAGQGTLGMELIEQAPDLDAVFISVGGGGLIGSVGTVFKHLSPKTRIVGVWPENSPCMLRAIEAGKVVDVEEQDTISDGTAGAIEPNSVTVPICKAVIDETVMVTEAQIGLAMRRLAEAEHWIVEGAAGVALAGLANRADAYAGRRVAVVLCGRNIALEKFLSAIGAD